MEGAGEEEKKMIVISSPIAVANEIKLIHQLFAEGLPLLHVRKPDLLENEMKQFLSLIDAESRCKLVLHQHHHLAEDFGINKIHYTEINRINLNINIQQFQNTNKAISTSVHNMNDFNSLNNHFEYAFLSPVYPSISKPDYVGLTNHLGTLKQRTNFNTHLIALGGITAENIKKTLLSGFDAVALLGTIWNSENPIKKFISCQKIVRSF